MFITAFIIHSDQNMETTKVSFEKRLVKKMWYICAMKYCSTIRKDEMLQFVTTGMDFEIITLSETPVRKS